MDLFVQIQAALQNDLTSDSSSTIFPIDTIKLAINRAYRKIGGAYRWPQTEDAQKTSAQANQQYYDYPQNFRTNTMWKLRVDGQDYGQPMLFKDFQYEVENQVPSGNKFMWANQDRRYFIYPTPTVTGSNNIEIWGYRVVDLLSNDNDTTIFSYNMPECNEAILLEAAAILRTKTGDEPVMLVRYFQGTFLLSLLAKQIVTDAFAKIKQDDSQRQKTLPQFNVPDYFRPGISVKNKIGDFDI